MSFRWKAARDWRGKVGSAAGPNFKYIKRRSGFESFRGGIPLRCARADVGVDKTEPDVRISLREPTDGRDPFRRKGVATESSSSGRCSRAAWEILEGSDAS